MNNKKKIIFFALIFLLSIYNINKMFSKNQRTAEYSYTITKSVYEDENINIYYPQIAEMKNIENQFIINNIIKEEVFSELIDWTNTDKNNLRDINISIEYEISFQNDKYLSFKFFGFTFSKFSSYPNEIFSTLNIELQNAKKIKLEDIVDINNDFINITQDTLKLYSNLNPDWRPVYINKLRENNFPLEEILKKSDTKYSSDCYSYLTKDSLGIRFSASNVEGDYFDIEIKYEDFEDILKINITK